MYIWGCPLFYWLLRCFAISKPTDNYGDFKIYMTISKLDQNTLFQMFFEIFVHDSFDRFLHRCDKFSWGGRLYTCSILNFQRNEQLCVSSCLLHDAFQSSKEIIKARHGNKQIESLLVQRAFCLLERGLLCLDWQYFGTQ